MKTTFFTVLILASAAVMQAQVVIDLRTGSIHDLGTNPAPTRAAGLTYTNAYMKVTVTRNPNCTITPFQALVEMNLKPTNAAEMKRAYVDVDYISPNPTASNPVSSTDIPSGWVTHLGDDPANDGYGGGTDVAGGSAEAHVTSQQFLIYSTAIAAGSVQNILAQDMQLEKGSLRFEIANQFLAWGQPRNVIDSTAAKKLFAFPDAKGDYRLFTSFNRVISGRTDRTGCGAARAILQLEAQ
jgi:hypothetical protein